MTSVAPCPESAHPVGGTAYNVYYGKSYSDLDMKLFRIVGSSFRRNFSRRVKLSYLIV